VLAFSTRARQLTLLGVQPTPLQARANLSAGVAQDGDARPLGKVDGGDGGDAGLSSRRAVN